MRRGELHGPYLYLSLPGRSPGPGCSTFQPNWPNRCGGVSTSAAVESALAEISAITWNCSSAGASTDRRCSARRTW